MKRKIALILVFAALLTLCAACGKDTIGGTDPGFDAVSAAVKGAADSDIMQSIPDSYMKNTMKIGSDAYTEGYAAISKVGININEYGVFKTDDPAALKSALEDYLQYREEIWMDEYLPEEHPKLENAQVWAVGDYVMYAILDSETLDAAEIAFKGCFEG